ncbi:MAG: hypothetical protein KKE51_14475 [Gammaproteobacteria bacterium]|nr:hypothetical protein [Gammaproteobacteria bacterium]MBU1601914.1 hypothetical protein [Gammaproteobacteria bacterium]MBU2432286.1 hypothetical protein [Gammaproteobacteria bacterium]MBU2450321.1 hypothetical protein [Gammaproteobacteria bacterium]
MKINRLASTLLVAGLALGATASHADGLTFFPGLQSGFKFEPSVAVSVGVMGAPAANDDSMFVYGLDFNMNCGLIQTPDNRIRTHIQINHIDESGMKSTSFELSPRYTLPVGGGFSVGAGPVLGLVQADNGRADKSLFGYGAVVGANYRKGLYYSGLDLRYLNTSESDNVSFENWALLAKVGINF